MNFGAAVLLMALAASGSPGMQQEKTDLYGDIPREKYLIGRFDPDESGLFTELAESGIATDGRKQYLRKEAAAALKVMFKDFSRQHPGVRVYVRSSTRTFWHQKAIWENKWYGRTRVGGRRLNVEVGDELERARIILRYSSMPGTSRHHWGTDFDINSLNNSWYEKGVGRVIYSWLKKNAERYGFVQPYIGGRSAGYEEEKWHWSYRPLARRLLKDWNEAFKNGEMQIDGFAGAGASGGLAPEYVNGINPDCR